MFLLCAVVHRKTETGGSSFSGPVCEVRVHSVCSEEQRIWLEGGFKRWGLVCAKLEN